MTVLSDRQIKQLCTPPTFVIIEKVSQPQDPHHDVYIIPKDVASFTHMDEKEILAKQKCAYGATGIIHIRQLTTEEITNFKPMISPFVADSIKVLETDKGPQRILSYGTSSYGYDMVLSKVDLKIFTNINSTIVDPRNVDPRCYTAPELRTDDDGLLYVIQPPNSIMLGHTREWFNIPRNILATCLGKSTYARVGVSLIVTPLEPEWSGNLVVEIVNHTSSPVKIYPEQGIGQLTFMQAAVVCETSYADRGGKYQSQTGTTDAKV